MLYHISEQPDIARFEPRPSEYTDSPVVWAIHEQRVHNYLLPRDCPRVTFCAGPSTTRNDAEKFLGESRCVIAIEECWIDRIRDARLYRYVMPPASFRCSDEIAGYYVSDAAVIPTLVEPIAYLLDALKNTGAEVRLLPSLWNLHDAVLASTLHYSMIRMRNALPRTS